MVWLREFYRDLRFLARHSRRLIKVLIRNRMGYKRLLKAVSDGLREDGTNQPRHHVNILLDHESRKLGRPAQYIGQTDVERANRHSRGNNFYKGDSN